MKMLMLAVGVLATCLGLLWIGQGLDYINWPADSFMLGQARWIYIGGFVVIIGLGLVAYSQRQKS